MERQTRRRGHRTFTQDLEDPSCFWEATGANKGTPFSEEDIAVLEADGWQCVVIEYTHNWKDL